MTIYKYPLQIAEQQVVYLPTGTLLDIAEQEIDSLYVWYQINDPIHKEPVKFFIFGTGHNLDVIENMQNVCYVKTIHMKSGYVWHIYMEYNV